MAIAMVAMSASATKIYVCGTKITGTTSFSAAGGTVSYNNSSRTLTISNVDYVKSGGSNNGISVDEVDGPLTIYMVTTSFDIKDADAVLCKSGKPTTITVSGDCYFTCRSQSHAGLKLQDGDVTINGSGELIINNTTTGNAIKGGAGTESLTLQIKNLGAYSGNTRIHHLKKVTINPTGTFGGDDYSTKVILDHQNTDYGYAAASEVSSWSAGSGVKILKPVDYYNTSLSNLTNSNFSGETIITDYTPVAVLNSSYFPDANFRGYLLRQFPKGYITTSDVNATTSLNASSEYISSVQGIGYFSKLVNFSCEENILTSLPSLPSTLKYLNCRDNRLSSLPSLPSGLTTLICDQNLLTALPTMPSSLQTLECENNRLSGTVNLCNLSLKSLQIKNNPYMTTLLCYNNALTSLNLAGCSALTAVHCNNNQLTSLSYLPTSLQHLYCNNNKFSGTFELTDRSNLKTLDISSNPNITYLKCNSNALTSLNVNGCTALTKLDCYNNQLTSLDVSSLSNLNSLICYSNKLTSLNVANKTKLRIIQAHINQLTSINVNGCTALQDLLCGENKLSSLSVQGCNSLRLLNFFGNQIKESAMNTLINSLCTIPVGSTGNFDVIFPGLSGSYTEGNVITDAQVLAARNKRWLPKMWDGINWLEIIVSTPGDVNGDGDVSSVDVTVLYNYLLNNDSQYLVNGDQDGDGIITSADIMIVYNLLLGN